MSLLALAGSVAAWGCALPEGLTCIDLEQDVCEQAHTVVMNAMTTSERAEVQTVTVRPTVSLGCVEELRPLVDVFVVTIEGAQSPVKLAASDGQLVVCPEG